MLHSNRKGYWVLVFVVVMQLGGCAGESTGPGADGVVSVTVSPDPYTFTALDDTHQFSAVAKDVTGTTIGGVTFTWRSSAPSSAEVDANGRVTAMGVGTATITATGEGISGDAAVTVRQDVVALNVTPGADTLSQVGDTSRFSAVAMDANGNAVSAVAFEWSSSNEDVATIDVGGLATARGFGEAAITAEEAGGVSDSADLTVEGLIALAAGVSAGGIHTCGTAADGVGYCWGLNQYGALGDGSTTTRTTPTAVLITSSFGLAASGDLHTCALTPAGAAYCWGTNSFGQLGDGTTTQRTEPVAVIGGLTFTSLSAGGASGNGEHTCAVTTDGDAYCWGANSRGQLGDGTTTNRATPVAVAGGLKFVSLSAAGLHTCGLTTDRKAYCWGENYWGQLGDGTTTRRTTPVQEYFDLRYISLDAGMDHTCGVLTTGYAVCWGRNNHGQLGDGTTTDHPIPTAVTGGLTFYWIDAGGRADVVAGHTCAVTSGGVAYCWGANSHGQLGDGTTTARTTPTLVAGGLGFSGVTCGGYHTCGLTSGGDTYCWGSGQYGQLGDGGSVDRNQPVLVVFP